MVPGNFFSCHFQRKSNFFVYRTCFACTLHYPQVHVYSWISVLIVLWGHFTCPLVCLVRLVPVEYHLFHWYSIGVRTTENIHCILIACVWEVSGQFASDNSPPIFKQLAPRSFIHYRAKRDVKCTKPRLIKRHRNYSSFLYPIPNKLFFVLLSTTESEVRGEFSGANCPGGKLSGIRLGFVCVLFPPMLINAWVPANLMLGYNPAMD